VTVPDGAGPGGPEPTSPDAGGSPRRNGRSTARTVDPEGRHALFSTPPTAARDQLAPGNQKEGRDAFFSTGPRQPGTVVVICSSCDVRSRITLVDLGVRFLSVSFWVPLRGNGHWMRCPGCHSHQWCRIAWTD
jgi:hypothetical protein